MVALLNSVTQLHKNNYFRSKERLARLSTAEVDELNGMTDVWMILSKPFVKMNIFEENSFSQLRCHRKTKRCTIKLLKVLAKNMKPIFKIFSVKQIQIKFKNCVSQCKRVSLLQKTTFGVKNFVQNKGLAQWFIQLYQFVRSRDSWKPQWAIGPTYSVSASKKTESKEKREIEDEVAATSRETEKGNSSKISTEDKNSVSQTRFLPVKKNKIKRRNRFEKCC